MKKKIRNFILIIITAITIFILSFLFTPYPMSFFIRQLFKIPPQTSPEDYDYYKENVLVKKNIDYNSNFPKGYLDIYSPKNNNKKIPTIIWIHGGAFVGGDKNDIEFFSTMISYNNYNIVCMNYDLAPESKYPTPIIQFEEAYNFLIENNELYNLDMTKIFIAGDSAGGHIVSQLGLLSSSHEYEKITNIENSIPRENLKGLLLYCGIYNTADFENTSSKEINFIINKVGWAYLGDKNFKEASHYPEISTINYVTKDFPNTFITDGNKGSFEKNAKDFEKKLLEEEVSVNSVFFDIKEYGESGHEYQFKLDTIEGQIALEETLKFLKNNSD